MLSKRSYSSSFIGSKRSGRLSQSHLLSNIIQNILKRRPFSTLKMEDESGPLL